MVDQPGIARMFDLTRNRSRYNSGMRPSHRASRLISCFAIFVFLCQTLSPASGYSASLQASSAFGEICSAAPAKRSAATASVRKGGASPATSQGQHRSHCPLCLGQPVGPALPVALLPYIHPLNVAQTTFVTFADAWFTPAPLRTTLPRGPPVRSAVAG